MSDGPDVSIVISSFNTRSMLEACLRSVLDDLAQSRLGHEVIVVDDASTDGSSEMVATLFPAVNLVRHTHNQGYAKANNAGILAASGSAIVLLNSDTVVLPGSIPAMFDALTQRGDRTVVGPKLLNPDGTVQRSCWRFPLESLIGNSLFLFRLGLWSDYRAMDSRIDSEVDWMSSAALMIPRSAFEDVGVFDERFWVYGVDVDWAMRAQRKGYRYCYLSKAKVIHHGRASWRSAYDRMSWDDFRATGLVFHKHYGSGGLLLYRVVLLINSITRLLIWGIPYLLGKRELSEKVAYFRRLGLWSVVGSTHRLDAPAVTFGTSPH